MILKNKVIVFLGNMRSDGPIKATSLFIARNLAKDNKVFFIDYPFTLKDYFKYIKSDEVKDRKKKFPIFSDGIIETDLPNLKIVITPPVIPINFLPEGLIFRSMLKINENFICWRLKKIFKKESIKEFIYINSFNFHYPNIANKIKPTLTVYQCVDPMIIPYDMKHGIKSEKQLVQKSDLVICTSKALYLEKKLLNKHTYFIPNGADSSHDLTTTDNVTAVHPKIKDLRRPIIGYLGTIERRINYELVREVMEAHPDKTFVFAGPVDYSYVPEYMFKLPNIHFLGIIPYLEVPHMINSFDVAIIPFKKDEVSETIFPIKLFEYLSVGKPVILTNFNLDLKDYTLDLVEYCNDATSFSKAIESVIQNDSKDKAQQRKALANLNTWKERTDQISAIISAHLSSKAL